MVALACSDAATPPAAAPPTPRAATEAGTVAPPATATVPPAVAGSADPGGAPAPAAAGGACPEGMVLVDGDYCTDLEMKCLKSWFDTSNKKLICEEFARPTRCVGKKEKRRYCIDRYEYPNKKGERPEVMNNFYQAQVLCAARGRRVCTETEWTMACEGPEYEPYPYGYVRDARKCNGDRPYKFPSKEKLWARDAAEHVRLWQGLPSGSQPECVSDYGVFDLPGNTDELAASEQFVGRDAKFDNVTTGGPWYKGVRNQCRPKIYTHDEGFAYYYLSFRCCAEADGKTTDPRAPKQIRRGVTWERVQQLAERSLDLKPGKGAR
jgi:formylglycine-generating enzyme